jgi:glyoxylase-like metal-dependent hydrolase (beta-lactamase superfamily II)
MASARQVYGAALDRLFGRLAPVPADRIGALDDTGSIDLGGGRRLDSHSSPGHAKHHVGLIDSLTGDLYVGDAAGVYIPETGDLRPATPPPDFDLETALGSLRLFAGLRPVRLLFSHYGPVDSVASTLERSAEEIKVWVEQTRQARDSGLDLDHAVAMVQERTRDRYTALRQLGGPARASQIACRQHPSRGRLARLFVYVRVSIRDSAEDRCYVEVWCTNPAPGLPRSTETPR